MRVIGVSLWLLAAAFFLGILSSVAPQKWAIRSADVAYLETESRMGQFRFLCRGIRQGGTYCWLALHFSRDVEKVLNRERV
jgi:hypothetical protein